MHSPEPIPRPWRVESDNLTLRPPVCFVVDANGANVSGGFFSPADAALIVAAVNKHGMPIVELIRAYDVLEAERDRLRDLVRRLCDELESHYYEPQTMDDRSVIREARAALGEDKP